MWSVALLGDGVLLLGVHAAQDARDPLGVLRQYLLVLSGVPRWRTVRAGSRREVFHELPRIFIHKPGLFQVPPDEGVQEGVSAADAVRIAVLTPACQEGQVMEVLLFAGAIRGVYDVLEPAFEGPVSEERRNPGDGGRPMHSRTSRSPTLPSFFDECFSCCVILLSATLMVVKRDLSVPIREMITSRWCAAPAFVRDRKHLRRGVIIPQSSGTISAFCTKAPCRRGRGGSPGGS